MIQGVFHQPYGFDNLYSTEPTERAPRDPMAGDVVQINASTWPVENGQAVWILWAKNGVVQPNIPAQWQRSANDTSYWCAELGPLARGDQIKYSVHANENGANEVMTDDFGFSVSSWSHVTRVTGVHDNKTSVDLTLRDSDNALKPALRLSFPGTDTLHVEFAPTGTGVSGEEQTVYELTDQPDRVVIRTAELTVQIDKQPYRLSLFRHDGTTVITREYDPARGNNLRWAGDGKGNVIRLEEHLATSPNETFTGFGERYDYFNQYGHNVRTFIYNEYGDQAATDRTYLAVPFFLNSAGYGLYSSSTAYTQFTVGTAQPDMAGFTVNAAGPDPVLGYYLFTGSPKRILDRYTAISGRPQLPPKWAFGLWISANEWNNQQMVRDNLDAAAANQIPVTVLVLEQWADEATFYIWHGAQYQTKPGAEAFALGDFTFPPDGEWPDPKAMVADAHARGVRIVLWQIPAFKEIFTTPTPHYPGQAPQQLLNDKDYAVAQNYVVGDGSGNPARLPLHSWFGNSMIPDFTNPDGTAWWMSKREYLLDEVGIDGFKCDGGEAVFSRLNAFHDGRPGGLMHNAYPGTYIGAYNALLASKRGNQGAVFSRAGTAGAQSLSIYWAGDQLSSFDAFQAAIRAGLSAGASGIPYWAWDLSGFAGAFPDSELYLRATAMSTFSPVMQLHAQWAMPPGSASRTPWHVQQVTGDGRVIPIFRKFANVRMNLLPYIYSEAKHAALHGAPVMRAVNIDFPNDPNAAGLDQQYLFGGQMMVAPVTTRGAAQQPIYLPAGEWWDLWVSAPFSGPKTKLYGTPLDFIPAYAKPGAIIPLNLDDTYQLGSAVGNSVAGNANLTFRIFPSGATQYDYYDDARDAIATVKVNESWASHQVSVVVPGLSEPPALQVISSPPASVSVDGALLVGYPDLGSLQAAGSGWFWDSVIQATLVKLPESNAARVVTLNGVDKAAYRAEFAIGVGTTTNSNHAGFGGFAFVDGFETPGDSVTFLVSADATGDHALTFRYANADGVAATRNVYVDGTLVGPVTLAPLPNWDNWGTASIQTTLAAGPHQVRIAFDAENTMPINLDSLSLARVTPPPVNVMTQHNNNARTGANMHETVLTTTNVNAATFGKLFTYPVTGLVFAQPLYVSGVEVPGKGKRNVVYVATMNNRVYGFDADDALQASVPIWQRTLEPSIPLPDPNIGPTFIDAQKHDTGKATKPTGDPVYGDIQREVGILSTPVVSPDNHVLYVVTASKDPHGQGAAAYTHHLHALDLATGEERLGGPIVISASAPGAGYVGDHGEQDHVSNGRIRFVSHRQLQRSGLLLSGGTVYVCFASYGDKDCYHGWVLAYDAATLQQRGVFNTTPSAIAGADEEHVGHGGIWQAGAGAAADDTAMYFSTGNGGYADGTDFGDCFVKLDLHTLRPLDWFSPFNQAQLAANDIDLGSSGVMLIPGTNLIIGGGKESKFFLMKRDALGHYQPALANGQVVQHFYVHAPENPADPIRSARKYDGTGHHMHGAPAYWHGPQGSWIYIWPEEDVLKAYELMPNGMFSTTPITLTGIPNAALGVTASQGRPVGLGGLAGIAPGMPGGMISVSANGHAGGTGILWATHPLANANKDIVPGVLRAYDASDLTVELWNSKVNEARDDLGSYAKFSPPTIANGRVYVATFSGSVVVYGTL